jgi:predicted Zn-dependent protease
MKPLEPPDSHHLSAAQGWLGLGDWASANGELDEIASECCVHTAVLEVRVQICEAAGQWRMAAELARALTVIEPDSPFGWINWAYSLYELERTSEAREVLLPAADRFPGDYLIRYSLACYACQLGNLGEAREWLAQAISLADAQQVRQMAVNNPDLAPLWTEIENKPVA